jgi:Lectin C-type domain/PEP-CTERM motif
LRIRIQLIDFIDKWAWFVAHWLPGGEFFSSMVNSKVRVFLREFQMFKRALLSVSVAFVLSSPVAAVPVQWTIASGGNDHWYDFVATNLTWDDAFAAANATTFNGLQGYLATVTSALENDFVSNTVAGGTLAWLGASDAGDENNFTWRNGPEIGQLLTFTNWNPGEPNNCCGGENYLHTNFSVLGGWNDHGGPGNAGQVNGFLIEFSDAVIAVPEPATTLLLFAGMATGIALRRKRVMRMT